MSTAPVAAAPAQEPKVSRKKLKQNDGINGRLQIVMRYVFAASRVGDTTVVYSALLWVRRR